MYLLVILVLYFISFSKWYYFTSLSPHTFVTRRKSRDTPQISIQDLVWENRPMKDNELWDYIILPKSLFAEALVSSYCTVLKY